jgi:hypothetical protein
MHHKRRRPKNRRAGCLLCKPHKANGAKGSEEAQSLAERQSRAAARWELEQIQARRP